MQPELANKQIAFRVFADARFGNGPADGMKLPSAAATPS
jgi:hypothetical protein